jgi:transaldolase
MKIYLDSVKLDEIEDALTRGGLLAGLTVNPSFLRREAGSRTWHHLAQVVELARPTGRPVQVQVMTVEPAALVDQAEMMRERLDYRHLVVKVACGWEELRAMAELVRRGFTVNCTACMTAAQVAMGAAVGAQWAALFFGKMTDAGIDAAAMIASAADSMRREGSSCQLLIASIRKPYDVHNCITSGADAVTVTHDMLTRLARHQMTEFAAAQFAADMVPLTPEDNQAPLLSGVTPGRAVRA